jgi:uncharacterized repeat protein (TIGR03803 family)
VNKRLYLTLIAVFLLPALAGAQTFTTLYNFSGGTDGASPIAGVIQDSLGNLYGTTYQGGGSDDGVVFRLDTAGNESALYSFSGGTDGSEPFGPVLRDSEGSLYGSTAYGGDLQKCLVSGPGCGVVFKIDTAGNETVLHTFTGGKTDGCVPVGALQMDASGNLYGTASGCGAHAKGAVFKLTPNGKESLMHSFAGGSSDGAYPGSVLMDKEGNLYGVTQGGGGKNCGGEGCGVLFKLSKKGTLTMLHRFAGGARDGCQPEGSVAMDGAGNLYGTATVCGSAGEGNVWKVNKSGSETILHNFAGGSSDGCLPEAGVVLDSSGNLYGDTASCGASDYGTLYELSASGEFSLRLSFDGSNGSQPVDNLLWTANSELLGTAFAGGTSNFGTVFSYIP